MRNYFCGWYFKMQSNEKTLAIIPSYHKTTSGNHSSIQFITDHHVWVVEYPIEDFHQEKKGLDVSIHGNRFSEKGLHLDLHEPGFEAVGELSFGPWTGLKSDIMGPFRFVPLMECRHGVWSAFHEVNGSLTLNGEVFDFSHSKGYVEGDRGYSFPSTYIWTQCLFDQGSLMLSVADIPFGLFHFTGVIGFIHLDGKEYRLGTYCGAKTVEIGENQCTIRQGKMEFTAQLVRSNAHPLKAPVNGAMTRTIRESASCTAHYKLTMEGKTLLDLESDKASFEFEY